MSTEEPPELDRFTHTEAWALGRDLTERCLKHGHPVTISIVLGIQRAFHAALPGTSTDNDTWAARKTETVRHFGRSSASVYELYAKDNPDFYRIFALPESEYAAAGGAVPIRVRGALVGVLAISGLDSAADHQLALEAITAMTTQATQANP